MVKLAVLLMAVLVPSSVFATQEESDDMLCMGFQPEAIVICVDENTNVPQKVHAYEEKRCAAGRDGMLNDNVPIEDIDGPTWTGETEYAEVSFKYTDGSPVTLRNCSVVE